MAFEKVRWGILGTGRIASKFAADLAYLPDAELIAVGSRSQATADEFANQFNIPHRHPTYEALVADPDVDAIYISTPHPFHAENSLLCIDAGKAVLCEKPFAINAKQAETVIKRAREKQVFLLEAMWTRYIPAIVKVRELIAAGEIGEVRSVRADFGYRGRVDPNNRLYNPALGGGALLDVGIYPIALSYMVLGAPKTIQSAAHIGATGIDEHNGLLFGYEQGQIAILGSAISIRTSHDGLIMGTGGMIRIHAPFWHSTKLTVSREGSAEETLDFPIDGEGYQFEAAEVAACLRAGKLESDVLPLDETLSMMQTMDTIRAQWGMKYPGE